MQTNLSTNIGQRLIFTPRLAQSLKILAMNTVDLSEHIAECLDSNPMLENEMQSNDELDEATLKQEEKSVENDWRERGDDRWETMGSTNPIERSNPLENRLKAEKNIEQSLHEQIDCQPMSDKERIIAHTIIDSLDDDGYFSEDITSELVLKLKLSSKAIIEALEKIVHQLEPRGIGARNMKECLLLQLGDATETENLARRLLLNHSEHLFDSDHVLAEAADCSIEDIVAARARMRRLDPFPGHYLRSDDIVYIQPEVIFHRQPDRSLRIEIPDYSWNGVRLNKQWQGHTWQGTDKNFMKNASREATWLLDALAQRRKTLDKVAHCLAKHQRRFLEYGPIGLKPLTLQEVASEVGLHESTISRVTNGKYAQTPLGLIEMKRFFSAGLPVRGGGTIAVYKVQQRIKALIKSEPSGRPIADQTISEVLQAEGVQIARRTVAKYREQLGFAPTHQRKRAAPPVKARAYASTAVPA